MKVYPTLEKAKAREMTAREMLFLDEALFICSVLSALNLRGWERGVDQWRNREGKREAFPWRHRPWWMRPGATVNPPAPCDAAERRFWDRLVQT